MHVQTLQVQLTSTTSDSKEMKSADFRKVRRNEITIFVNKRK